MPWYWTALIACAAFYAGMCVGARRVKPLIEWAKKNKIIN